MDNSIEAGVEADVDRAEKDVEFVSTPTARALFKQFNRAVEARKPAIIYGPSQVGKTTAAQEFAKRPNKVGGMTYYVRLRAAGGLGGMVQTIARALRIHKKVGTNELVTEIKGKLNGSTGLIVDEMHLLENSYTRGRFFACIEVLREIYDETKCGLSMLWTRIDSLDAARDKELQQMCRRGVLRMRIGAPTKADVKSILEHAGLEFPERHHKVSFKLPGQGVLTRHPFTVLETLAKEGGLLGITERLRYAASDARKNGRQVTWADFIAAHLSIESHEVVKDDWAEKEVAS